MSTQRIGTVIPETLNVRASASTAQPPIGELRRGQTVVVITESADWDQIEYGKGTAYVAARYLSIRDGEAGDQDIFLPDVYSGHVQRPDWVALAGDRRFYGAFLKALEGVSFAPSQDWFIQQWEPLRAGGGDRYGTTWFRGAYHYLIMSDDGAAQAKAFLATVEKAGGWRAGDLPPICDVERGGASSGNHQASKQQVIDVTSAWAATVSQELGCKIMLYGRGAMRDLGITERMGCDFLWAPEYGSSLVSTANLGWPNELVKLWQYTDGTTNLTKYPSSAPGIGAGDVSLFRGGLSDLQALAALGPR